MSSVSSFDLLPAEQLLAWYDAERRDLPWRAAPGAYSDPYHVWLSEVMLQQTVVKTVIPYFHTFTQTWPTVEALAAAPREDILKAWAGLGYYARARNLHACAQVVADEYDGKFPATADELRALPGIGEYTAAAIAAIAFGEPVPVVDGNIERVISRRHAVATPLPKAKAEIKAKVSEILPCDRPGDFAQAMMDLGATVCTPKSPSCLLCPWSRDCAAKEAGTQTYFPVKASKKPKPLRFGRIFVLRNGNGEVFVRSRPDEGLLGGMTEFPGTAWADTKPAQPDWSEKVHDPIQVGEVIHVFTHFELHLEVVLGRIDKAPASDWRAVSRRKLFDEALPSVMRKVGKLALA